MKKKLSIQDICEIALMAAVVCILAQISVPTPFGVPITLQTFAVFLAGIILGPWKGFIALAVYLLLGAVGLPVFAGFSGGFHHLVGTSGGYLLSYPFMAAISGAFTGLRDKCLAGKKENTGAQTLGVIVYALGFVVATVVNYTMGGFVWAVIGQLQPSVVAAYSLTFIPGDAIKVVLAAVIGLPLRHRLNIALHR